MRILIHGHFGMRNVGDDAMLETIAQELRGRYPNSQIVVAAGEHYDRKMFERVRLKKVPRSIRGLALAIPGSDLFVVGGGTHLHSRKGKLRYLEDCFNQMLLLIYARMTGARCWMVGVGLGAFETRSAELVARVCCAACSFLSVRDKESYRWLTQGRQQKKYFRTIDPAYWLRIPDTPLRKRGRLFVSALPYFRNYGTDEKRDGVVLRAFEKFIRQWLELDPGNSVLLSVFNDKASDRDSLILGELHSKFRTTGRVDLGEYVSDPSEKFEEISECSHAIVMRYHALVYAHIAGLPVISLNYHQKNVAFCSEIGLPETARISMDMFTDDIAAQLAVSLFSQPANFTAAVDADTYRCGYSGLIN